MSCARIEELIKIDHKQKQSRIKCQRCADNSATEITSDELGNEGIDEVMLSITMALSVIIMSAIRL